MFETARFRTATDGGAVWVGVCCLVFSAVLPLAESVLFKLTIFDGRLCVQ